MRCPTFDEGVNEEGDVDEEGDADEEGVNEGVDEEEDVEVEVVDEVDELDVDFVNVFEDGSDFEEGAVSFSHAGALAEPAGFKTTVLVSAAVAEFGSVTAGSDDATLFTCNMTDGVDPFDGCC